jgi:serine/threonine protein kinase
MNADSIFPQPSELNPTLHATSRSAHLLSSSAPSRLPTQLPFGTGISGHIALGATAADRELLRDRQSWTHRETGSTGFVPSPPHALRSVVPIDDAYFSSVPFVTPLQDGVPIGGPPTHRPNNDKWLMASVVDPTIGSNQSNLGVETDNQDDSDDDSRLIQLLNLLDTFVRLKESIGVERAILSSLLAAGQVDSRLMLTDLLLELENQRRHVGKLIKLLPRTGVLHNLVRELVSMSPQMKQLQNSITQGFDMDSFKSKFDSQGELWSLLTLYIDKLHSLELILVEEIECNASVRSAADDSTAPVVPMNGKYVNASPDHSEALSDNGASDRINWLDVFDMAVGCTVRDLRSRIEDMTPVEVKQRLLGALPVEENSHSQPNATRDGAAISSTGNGVDDLLAQLSKAPASKEWEIDLYEIRFIKRIGQGTAGTTYLADWAGLKVAVKVASISELGLDGWRTEVQALQKLHHPNIIRLLGSVCHPSPLTFCLVLEYCDAGDLSGVLKTATPSNFFFRVADGIAKGGTYLHKKGVIHRDIKPGNILLEGDVVSGQFNVKLTDFGVSTDSTLSGERTAETGTYRYMAGEVIRHENYSQSADVYSFAVVLWQLVTREEPFQDKSQVEAASAVAFEYARPPFPETTPVAVKQLIETCWSNEPDERLTFERVIAELQSIDQSLKADEKKWIEAPLGHSAYRKTQSSPGTSQRQAFQQQRSIPRLQVPNSNRLQQDDKKKKSLRTLFNRKSVHF